MAYDIWKITFGNKVREYFPVSSFDAVATTEPQEVEPVDPHEEMKEFTYEEFLRNLIDEVKLPGKESRDPRLPHLFDVLEDFQATNHHDQLLYKVVKPDGRPPSSHSPNNFQYDLPVWDGDIWIPGDWTEPERPSICNSGYHATATPCEWAEKIHGIFRVYAIQTRGQSDTLMHTRNNPGKSAHESIRLIHPMVVRIDRARNKGGFLTPKFTVEEPVWDPLSSDYFGHEWERRY